MIKQSILFLLSLTQLRAGFVNSPDLNEAIRQHSTPLYKKMIEVMNLKDGERVMDFFSFTGHDALKIYELAGKNITMVNYDDGYGESFEGGLIKSKGLDHVITHAKHRFDL